jgi:hypothetical protein
MLEKLIAQQNALLLQVIDLLTTQDAPTLGFGNSPRPQYVYCNRTNGGNWYTLNDAREPVSIPHTALTGIVEGLRFEEVERRGKGTWKTHLTVRADKTYILECGSDSQFSKGILAGLASLTPAQLRQPITIEPQPHEEDEILLFCRIYVGGERVNAPYNGSTDWRAIARKALDGVKAATGKGDEAIAA